MWRCRAARSIGGDDGFAPPAFVDIDQAIEKKEGMKVREIFDHTGEAYFRRLEKQTLAEVLERNGQVIATGGGAVLDEENLALLKKRSLLWS